MNFTNSLTTLFPIEHLLQLLLYEMFLEETLIKAYHNENSILSAAFQGENNLLIVRQNEAKKLILTTH